MKIAAALQGVARLFFDTAPVIYYVEGNPTYAALVNDIFDRVDAGMLQAVTSPITLAECLVGAIRQGPPQAQQDFTDLNAFLTNDRMLQRVQELPILVLDDLAL